MARDGKIVIAGEEVSKRAHDMGKELPKEKITNPEGKEVSKHHHDMAVASTGTFTRKIMERSEQGDGYLWIHIYFSCCKKYLWKPNAAVFDKNGKKKKSVCPNCGDRICSWDKKDEKVSKDKPQDDDDNQNDA